MFFVCLFVCSFSVFLLPSSLLFCFFFHRLSYLTSLDCMILYSFFNLFMVVIETVIVRMMSQRSLDGSWTKAIGGLADSVDVTMMESIEGGQEGNATEAFFYSTNLIINIDLITLTIYPILFHVVELALPIYALYLRRKYLKKIVSGTDGDVDYGLSCETWTEEWEWMNNKGKEKAIRKSRDSFAENRGRRDSDLKLSDVDDAYAHTATKKKSGNKKNLFE